MKSLQKHYHSTINIILSSELRKAFHYYQPIQSYFNEGGKNGFIEKCQFESLAKYLGISRNALVNRLGVITKSGMAVKCKTGVRIIGIKTVLESVLKCKPYEKNEKLYHPFEWQNSIDDLNVKNLMNVLKQSHRRFEFQNKANKNARPKGKSIKPDNVVTYKISMEKIAKASIYKHLDKQAAKNLVCKSIKKAEQEGKLLVCRTKIVHVCNYIPHETFKLWFAKNPNHFFANGSIYKKDCNEYSFRYDLSSMVKQEQKKIRRESINPYSDYVNDFFEYFKSILIENGFSRTNMERKIPYNHYDAIINRMIQHRGISGFEESFKNLSSFLVKGKKEISVRRKADYSHYMVDTWEKESINYWRLKKA